MKKKRHISPIIAFSIIITCIVLLLPSHLIFEETTFLSPSDPIPIKDIIQVEGYNSDDVDINLTAVSSIDAKNIIQEIILKYGYKYISEASKKSSSNTNVKLNEEYMNGITNRSINNAVYLSYKWNNKELPIKKSGLLVLYNFHQVDDKKTLQNGDIILKLNDVETHTRSSLATEISKYKEGDTVKIEVLRDQKEINILHKLIKEDNKVMLGINVEEYMDIDIPKEVIFNRGNLEGPSGGLMFTLYLIDTLSDENIAKGYKVAGTGTINKDKKVGQIGGIEFKLQGAIKNNVDIFFVPKDKEDYDANQKDAEAYLKSHPSNIKLIPVETLDEALNYLNNLKEKTTS